NINENELKFIFKEAEIKAVFVSGKNDVKDKIKALKNEFAQLQFVISFDDENEWNKLLEKHTETDDLQKKLEKLKSSVTENDVVTIIYNSGEGGEPKGAMLSHKNIVSNVKGCLKLLPENTTKKALSFLPL